MICIGIMIGIRIENGIIILFQDGYTSIMVL